AGTARREARMIVDAHQHYWQLARADYDWLTPAMGPLYRDFLPADLAPELARSEVDATVLVQAATTEAETRFLLDLSATTPSVAVVVGWVDKAAAEAVDRLAVLHDESVGRLKGVRPMLQDIPDDRWVLSPSLNATFKELTA